MIRLNSKANWKQIYNPHVHGDAYAWGMVTAIVSRDAGYWHVSVAHPRRYPTWDEIYTAWYDLVPGAGSEFEGAIILPRRSEYVNAHRNCFHVHQLKDSEMPPGVIL
jgi:hypothetical protein